MDGWSGGRVYTLSNVTPILLGTETETEEAEEVEEVKEEVKHNKQEQYIVEEIPNYSQCFVSQRNNLSKTIFVLLLYNFF